jgi:hypothetical protein
MATERWVSTTPGRAKRSRTPTWHPTSLLSGHSDRPFGQRGAMRWSRWRLATLRVLRRRFGDVHAFGPRNVHK